MDSPFASEDAEGVFYDSGEFRRRDSFYGKIRKENDYVSELQQGTCKDL